MPRNLTALKERVFLEKDPNKFDPRINKVKSGTTLVGYFQSAKYFPTISSLLANAISKAEEDSEESDYLAELRESPRITLHLRRGDYLTLNPSAQLIASVDYAKRAVSHLRDLGLSAPLRIFSDSPELVKKELWNFGEEFEFVETARLHSGFNTIKAMAAGEAIITSNSSFSWWAAWLMQQEKGTETRVISPRPWNESGSARADMIGHNWISLDARPGER